MLVRPSQYVRPTAGPYAFPLLPVAAPGVPAVGTRTSVSDVEARMMGTETAARFSARVHRWAGLDDVDARGERPYQGLQLAFEEAAWTRPLTMAHVDTVLRGTVLVFRKPGGVVDYVLRDHHMLDVVLYHAATTGHFPTSLLHVDRHSDWCDDRFLLHRNPPQAATWWALLPGLKRADGTPVLTERDVHFVTAQAVIPAMSGRNMGASVRVPGFLDPALLGWNDAVERLGRTRVDWLSLDLDCFQPQPQLRLMHPLLRDPRFHQMLADAAVRVFCLSPQFTNGGDVHQEWTVQGHLHSTLRVMNLLRAR